jgi:hypothetical protein
MGVTYRWLSARLWSDAIRTLAWFAVFWAIVIGTLAALLALVEIGN